MIFFCLSASAQLKDKKLKVDDRYFNYLLSFMWLSVAFLYPLTYVGIIKSLLAVHTHRKMIKILHFMILPFFLIKVEIKGCFISVISNFLTITEWVVPILLQIAYWTLKLNSHRPLYVHLNILSFDNWYSNLPSICLCNCSFSG